MKAPAYGFVTPINTKGTVLLTINTDMRTVPCLYPHPLAFSAAASTAAVTAAPKPPFSSA